MLSSTSSETVFPGESGSLAEALHPVEGLNQAAGELADVSSSAAFNFTGHTASANGATMQEYFVQVCLL